jgi:hypothetical protein
MTSSSQLKFTCNKSLGRAPLDLRYIKLYKNTRPILLTWQGVGAIRDLQEWRKFGHELHITHCALYRDGVLAG